MAGHVINSLAVAVLLTFSFSVGTAQNVTASPEIPSTTAAFVPNGTANSTSLAGNSTTDEGSFCVKRCQPSACQSNSTLCPAFQNAVCIVDLCGCNARFLTSYMGTFMDVTAFCQVNRSGSSSLPPAAYPFHQPVFPAVNPLASPFPHQVPAAPLLPFPFSILGGILDEDDDSRVKKVATSKKKVSDDQEDDDDDNEGDESKKKLKYWKSL